MNAEKLDLDPQNDGREAENEPGIPFGWLFLALFAGGVPLGAMARGLYLALDLPKDSQLVTPALLIVLLIACVTPPKTFRQRATVVSVGVLVGAVAMLCFLPFTIFVQDFENYFQRDMLRLLGMIPLVGLGLWIARLACRRLAVPEWDTRAESSSNRDVP